jgi:hypothetical protein
MKRCGLRIAPEAHEEGGELTKYQWHDAHGQND